MALLNFRESRLEANHPHFCRCSPYNPTEVGLAMGHDLCLDTDARLKSRWKTDRPDDAGKPVGLHALYRNVQAARLGAECPKRRTWCLG